MKEDQLYPKTPRERAALLVCRAIHGATWHALVHVQWMPARRVIAAASAPFSRCVARIERRAQQRDRAGVTARLEAAIAASERRLSGS